MPHMFQFLISLSPLWAALLVFILSCGVIVVSYVADCVREPIVIWWPVWIPALTIFTFCAEFFFPQVVLAYLNLFYASAVLLTQTLPIWMSVTLAFAFWNLWVRYVRAKYLAKQNFILLEIKLPVDVLKSPLAMETFLMSLHQTGRETTFIMRYWLGQVRAQFSLEIVSIEGNVKFYIYTTDNFKKFIESSLYAHYPNIEIYESPDYTHSVGFDLSKRDMYVIDYKFANSSAYPIKTYVDYGIEDENIEEETKIDPINHIIEYLGSVGPNQQVWLQIVIRAHKGEQPKPGTFFEKFDKWKDEAKSEVEKIRAEALPKGSDPTTVKFPNPTKGQQEKIGALERSTFKLPFDAGVRCVYMGEKGFYSSTNISPVRTLLRPFSAPHLNSFKPTNWTTVLDYPWQDFMDLRRNRQKKEGFEAYKRRAFFYGPLSDNSPILVLNTEELATMFHLPGRVSSTPGLVRVPSKKGQAPTNLPI